MYLIKISGKSRGFLNNRSLLFDVGLSGRLGRTGSGRLVSGRGGGSFRLRRDFVGWILFFMGGFYRALFVLTDRIGVIKNSVVVLVERYFLFVLFNVFKF